MIVSKTPLRMSFVGGGSDLRVYYSIKPGAVVSTAIDKYVYVAVNRRFDGYIRVSYSKSETVKTVDEVEHEIIREAMKITGTVPGVEVNYMGDIPIGHSGTGLGSSSALAVGVLYALYALQKRAETISPERLAREACEIEIDRLHRPIGKQDQYAAAYGGFNRIQFNPDESVTVSPLALSLEKLQELQKKLLLFYTGLATESSKVLAEQKEKTADNRAVLDQMVLCAAELQIALECSAFRRLGELLHENWLCKKKLASAISNSIINTWYEKALAAGAVGGKILGSGGGGFLLFYIEPERQEAVRGALNDLREAKFRFEPLGSRIVYNDER